MKKILMLSMIILVIYIIPVKTFAWSQDTHENINFEALKVFNEKSLLSNKYEMSPIQETLLFKGLKTISASKMKDNYKDTVTYNTFSGWVIHGGYSADEPNIYEGVRHFYDPLYMSENLWGESVAYLTDQVALHALSSLYETYEVPAINALEWGIDHKDNPYSFEKALEYYYEAMTTSESESVTGFDAEDLFRIRDIDAKSLEDQRNLYLGAAFRGLGETMHLLSDMMVPAHVRNDGHVSYDPLEDRITGNEVRLYAHNSVDSRLRELFYKAGGVSPYSIEEIFVKLATFTNENFYSGDTIYDAGEGVYPANGEANYPSPQFSKLTKSATVLNNGTEVKTWNGNFDGVQVPLTSQSLLSVILEDDNSYSVSPSNALEQGKVLIPIAVAACADLIDRFFPTLEMTAEAGDESEIEDKNGNGYAGIELDVNLLHHYDQDPEWDEDMEIKYCGPGKLIFKEDGKIIRELKVNFEDGVIREIQVGKAMKEQPLMLYKKRSAKTKLSKEEAQYEITDKTTVTVLVDAGARVILSEEIDFDDNELDMEIDCLPEEPVKADEISFSTQSIDNGYYVWDFGDGTAAEGYGELTVKHRYEKEDGYEVVVTCYSDDKKEKVIGRGETEISVGEKFAITINPGSNLEAKAKDTVEISAVPADSRRTFEGLTIKWILDKAESTKPNNDKVQFVYNNEGRYSIIVQALDKNSVVVGEGKATIDITKAEQKTDARLEYFLQFDRGYYKYDYSKFVLDEREGRANVQESNYLGGMVMTFHDKENTKIASVYYYRTDKQVDYGKFCEFTDSSYTVEDFKTAPHVLTNLVRKTEWARDAYDTNGNLFSQYVMQMDDNGLSYIDKYLSSYEGKFMATSTTTSTGMKYDGKLYWFSADTNEKGIENFTLNISSFNKGALIDRKEYWYIENYKQLQNGRELAAAIKSYFEKTFNSVADVDLESNYLGILELSKNIVLKE